MSHQAFQIDVFIPRASFAHTDIRHLHLEHSKKPDETILVYRASTHSHSIAVTDKAGMVMWPVESAMGMILIRWGLAQ